MIRLYDFLEYWLIYYLCREIPINNTKATKKKLNVCFINNVLLLIYLHFNNKLLVPNLCSIYIYFFLSDPTRCIHDQRPPYKTDSLCVEIIQILFGLWPRKMALKDITQVLWRVEFLLLFLFNYSYIIVKLTRPDYDIRFGVHLVFTPYV